MLLEPNGGALLSAFQLEQTVKSPIYDGRGKFSAADKPLRVPVLRSPTTAVIESALLMLLIGWIDYKTTDFAITLFYFAPVVLATWRAGRKAGWFIATQKSRCAGRSVHDRRSIWHPSPSEPSNSGNRLHKGRTQNCATDANS